MKNIIKTPLNHIHHEALLLHHSLLCLRDYQVRWLAETIMVICFLYIFKTIKVCRHVETIMIICFLYFSKAIKVCCLVETINVFCSLSFKRLSESFVETSMSPLLCKTSRSCVDIPDASYALSFDRFR